MLQNIASIKTKGHDLNIAYHTRRTRYGTFGITWNNTWLEQYDVIVPITGGTQTISRLGTEQGSPSQGFPHWKSIGILDWDLAEFGATLTGRYVSKLTESDRNVMGDRLFTDVQLRWSPSMWNHMFSLAVGANNVLNTRIPGCNTCDLNNFDPTMLRRAGPVLLRSPGGEGGLGARASAGLCVAAAPAPAGS